jgi:hypothetical protein
LRCTRLPFMVLDERTPTSWPRRLAADVINAAALLITTGQLAAGLELGTWYQRSWAPLAGSGSRPLLTETIAFIPNAAPVSRPGVQSVSRHQPGE